MTKDTRIFATSKGAVDSNGEIVTPIIAALKVIKQKKRRNYKPILYIFYAPLLLIDWAFTLLANITEIVANSIKTLALSLETYINADTISAVPPTETD